MPDQVNGSEPAETFGDAFQRIEAMEFAAFIARPFRIKRRPIIRFTRFVFLK